MDSMIECEFSGERWCGMGNDETLSSSSWTSCNFSMERM